MLHEHRNWRDLYCCEGLDAVRAIATSIEAMEYETRVVDLRTGRPMNGDAGIDPAGRFVLQVRDEEMAELAGVVDEVVAEQDEFDEYLHRRDRRIMNRRRLFLGVMIALVAVLATLGLIEL